MNIERAFATPGMMSEQELTYLAELASARSCIAEIGSWRGRSSRAIADNTSGTLFCIDTWADNMYGPAMDGDAPDLCQHPDWLWNEFSKHMGDKLDVHVFPLRMNSIEGARCLQAKGVVLDMVFIDAGHNYGDVVSDIQAWRPLLSEGGILCGHDYNSVHHSEVIRAVNDLVPKFRVIDTIWSTEGV